MLPRIHACCVVIGLVVSAAHAQDAPAVPFSFSGDGLTVVVTQYDDDQGAVAGTIEREGRRYPFTGKLTTEDDAEVVQGSFSVGGERFPFRTRQAAGSDEVLFTTGNRTYRLRPGGRLDAAPAGENRPAAPAGGATTLDQPLKRVTFRDMSMGGVVSHHMLIPVDWKHEGHIEWSQDTYFPQTRVKVTGPDGSRITLMPAMNFSYTEVNPVPGFEPIPPQGTPPPQRLGEWVVSAVRQYNPAASNVQLISDERDMALEASQNAANQQMRSNAQDERFQVHRITYAYDMDGSRYREQWLVSYVVMPPLVNQNIRAVTWSLYPIVMVTAPDTRFEQIRPTLLAIYGTFRQVPKWWVQMMEVRSEIIAQRHRDNMEAIRRRGQMYDQMSDAQFRLYKQKMSGPTAGLHSDAAQDQRIQGIYEVQDYRDRDGSLVELSIHPKHVFSDGQGNLLLTNSYNDRPGAGWEEIRPVR